MIVVFAIDGLGPESLVRSQIGLKDFKFTEVASTIPYITPTGFMTLWTGLNPFQHAILSVEGFAGFKYYSHFTETFLSDLNDFKFWRVFDFLAEKGFRVSCIELPMSYFPIETKAEIFCNAKLPFEDSYWRGWKIAAKECFTVSKRLKPGTEEWNQAYLKALFASLELKRNLAVPELYDGKCDFLFFGFHEPDPIAHMLGFGEEYSRAMNIISEIISKFNDYKVFIVADHGLKEFERKLNLAKFLESRGYLKIDGNEFDFKASLAYPVTKSSRIVRQDFGIYINTQDKKEGKVPLASKLDLMSQIIYELNEIDGVLAEPSFKVYSGEFWYRAPDIYLTSPNGRVYFVSEIRNEDYLVPSSIVSHSYIALMGSNFGKLEINSIENFPFILCNEVGIQYEILERSNRSSLNLEEVKLSHLESVGY